MSKEWSFTFEIKPQAKQSTVFGNRHAFTPARKRRYVESLSVMALAKRPERMFSGAVTLTAEFYWAYPKSWPLKRRHVQSRDKKPDVDNLLKPLQDALTGIVYQDDSLVVCAGGSKYYGPKNQIVVHIKEL